MNRSRTTRLRVTTLVAAALTVGTLTGCGPAAGDINLGQHDAARAFPATQPGLTPIRQRIVAVLRSQYENPPESPAVYTEGIREPWCADFVSWTQRRAGSPVRNPTNGSWRIPGVATLADYYRSVGRFHGPDYRPKPGDVVIYEPPNRFKQHTNTVIAVDGDRVTTLGGNEPPNGISVNSYRLSKVRGIVGYGSPRRG
ncbi:MAG TPA: CHAP domain-containing protein [Gordonia sp. (in: high G+C Gram-positive bacteria)]|uniref:CHAP domain-containing protein n=1 Tax=unclassified Gordonia (in: high G+C Gram-positive bacteria) TaxID=2657482 RepID=UPI000F97086A|nr:MULTISPECIES: CHAP domain-containing protein [unclassified Gordonia (in: high G+C Gram-positive bacteria)]RUP41203.1 MAG: CHAP domain-containing protein [Gordonia sp. (in: high G+C Gram-positive bacteria)]HNP55602.1 CHAP domain-containing protein [Gordonia sp. (in: high G+C Gram-positive bacteria)]HRC50503.1 CHAP domain-containing protein [Gordonia sp. (in: high G+C Gram-positive bacteria)]